MKLYKSLIFIVVLQLQILYGQDMSISDQDVEAKFDTNYIKSYPQYFSIALFNNLPSVDLRISTSNKSNVNHYKSNTTNVVGFDLDYQGLSLMMGFRIKSDFASAAQKGETNYRLLSIKLHRHRFFAQASYTKSVSFYDENSYMRFPESTLEHPYMIRPEMTYKKGAIVVLYNLSHRKYSYLAPFAYTERQVKSKGGWLTAGGLYYYQLKDTGSIISNYNTNFTDRDTLNKRVDTYFLKLGFGRGMNLVLARRIFFNFQAMAYANLAYMNTFGNTADRTNISPNLFFEASAGMGYNSRRFFAGIRVSADRNTLQRNRFRYTNTTNNVQLNVGYRFDSPKWLDRKFFRLKHKAEEQKDKILPLN